MAIVTGDIEYITLRKVRAHHEMYIPDDELDAFKELPREIQEERLREDGEILIDDFGIDDIGDITDIDID